MLSPTQALPRQTVNYFCPVLKGAGFWDKSLRIFKCLGDNATQSIRHLAHQTGFSKSSVQRLKQAMARRNSHPESWFWETEAGRAWLTRLVVAALYTQ